MNHKVVYSIFIAIILILGAFLLFSKKYSINVNIVPRNKDAQISMDELVKNKSVLPIQEDNRAGQAVDVSGNFINFIKLSAVIDENSKEADLILSIAKRLGYLSDEGIEVDKKYSAFSSVLLSDGKADIAIGLVHNMIAEYLSGKNIVSVANISRPFSSIGLSRLSKQEVSQISKIAVARGAHDKGRVRRALSNLGLDVDQLKYIEVEDEKAKLTSLEKGESDFIFVDYFLAEKTKLLPNYTIFNEEELFKDFEIYGLAINSKATSEKREGIRRLVNALYKTRETLLNSKERAIELIADEKSISNTDSARIYDMFETSARSISFVPSVESISANVQQIKKTNAKLSDSERSLDLFVEKNYALEAVSLK